MAKAKKIPNKKILIKCDFADKVAELLNEVSVQLSDGYWESEENFYGEFWNCFNFDCESSVFEADKVAIIIKGEPTWLKYAKDTQKFLSMTDKEVCEYVKKTVFSLIDDYSSVFPYSDRELKTLQACMADWEILPPPLPKITHKELVALVGHDFEYVKG